MAKRNNRNSFEKRRRELKKRQDRIDKAERKLARRNAPAPADANGEDPAGGGVAASPELPPGEGSAPDARS